VRAGVVLAGGRSTRFGERDKAVASLAGTPMIRRVADRVGRVVDDLVVSCRDDQVPALAAALDGGAAEPTFARDAVPDEGPVAGVATGVRATDAEHAAVVACDMPFVDPDFLAYPFERVRGHDAAVPRLEGRFHPTQAVYRAAPTVRACERALDRGDRRLVDVLSGLDRAVVGLAALDRRTSRVTFENLNTREAFDAAAERLDGGD